MYCHCLACRKHPRHGGLNSKDEDEAVAMYVQCFDRSEHPVKLSDDVRNLVCYGESGPLVHGPRVDAEFTCAAYDECSGCPVCQPLPTWAKERYGEP